MDAVTVHCPKGGNCLSSPVGASATSAHRARGRGAKRSRNEVCADVSYSAERRVCFFSRGALPVVLLTLIGSLSEGLSNRAEWPVLWKRQRSKDLGVLCLFSAHQ